MPADIPRILDANANRAREALRVMEDYARFILNEPSLCDRLKSLRHALREALDTLPAGLIEAHRDTPGDVGTAVHTPAESIRRDTADVAIAAGKRLSEALRCLEEYGKLISPELGARIQSLRYEGYDLEQKLQTRLGCGSKVPQWRVCVILTESLCRKPWLEVLDAAIAGGADCLQLREKTLSDAKLLGRATVIVKRCRDAGVAAIINDRPDIALVSGAAGVHLGQTDLPVGYVRRLVGRRLIVGISTSSLVQAEAAQRSGADYCGVGPMFPTSTKMKPVPAGPDYLRDYLGNIRLPHLAIGGVNQETIAALVAAGARGVAVSAAVCGADDPAGVVAQLCSALDGACGNDA